MPTRKPFSAFRLLVLVLVLGTAPGLAAAPVEDVQSLMARDFSQTLGLINETLESLAFRIEVNCGETFLGSGSLSFQRGRFATLDLYSTTSACHYLNQAGSSTCLVRNGPSAVAFRASDSAQVPVPTIRIVKESDEAFQLDLRMNISTSSATQTMDLWVHPDTAAYLARRLMEKFPRADLGTDTRRFFREGAADPNVIIEYADGVIRKCVVLFPREQGAPLRLALDAIVVNRPLPAPEAAWLSGTARTVGSTLDSVSSFVSGFYGLLSEFVPRDEGPAQR